MKKGDRVIINHTDGTGAGMRPTGTVVEVIGNSVWVDIGSVRCRVSKDVVEPIMDIDSDVAD